MKILKKPNFWFLGASVFSIILAILWYGLLGYIAAHFILKFW